MKKREIYRKVAIERLSSPEQLDQVMQVTPARGWLALAAAAVLIAAAMIWAFAGKVPTRVEGTGVLIKTGGVYDIVATSSGHIADVAVRPGDEVREGQVVARIDQPLLVEKLREARARQAELEAQNRELRTFVRADETLSGDLTGRERQVLLRSLDAVQEEVQWLNVKLTGQEDLLVDGLIRREELLATEQQRAAAQIRVRQLQAEIQQIELRDLVRGNERGRELALSRQRLSEAKREVAHLEDQLRSAAQVRSPHTGRILEVMAEQGALGQQGRPLMRMDRVGGDVQNLEAVIYLPGLAGKRVTRGMAVQLSPAGVRREEHGYMIGSVATVSEFPASQEAMNRLLKNRDLVQMLAGGGASYEAFISLRLDPQSTDGYAWSSRAPGFTIESGTLCSATITTHERRPIELVAPFIRRFTGIQSQ